MKWLADENIPIKVVNKLRQEGFDIIRIDEIKPGLSDKQVIEIAVKTSRAVITFDKDFGKLIYREGYKVEAVVLLRFSPKGVDVIFQRVKSLLSKDMNLKNCFVVVGEKKLRVRRLRP